MEKRQGRGPEIRCQVSDVRCQMSETEMKNRLEVRGTRCMGTVGGSGPDVEMKDGHKVQGARERRQEVERLGENRPHSLNKHLTASPANESGY